VQRWRSSHISFPSRPAGESPSDPVLLGDEAKAVVQKLREEGHSMLRAIQEHSQDPVGYLSCKSCNLVPLSKSARRLRLAITSDYSRAIGQKRVTR
jgi:hypothetical protein